MSHSCIRFRQSSAKYARRFLAITSLLIIVSISPSVVLAQSSIPLHEKTFTCALESAAIPSPPAQANIPETSPLIRSGEAWKKGDIVTAIKEVEDALKEDDRQPDVLNWYGYLLLQQQRSGDAIPVLEKAIALGPETPELEANLGTALLLKPGGTPDELKRASLLLEKAVASRPDMLEAMANLGHAYLRTGKPVEAAAAYQKVLEKQPDNGSLYRMRGFALLKAGQVSEAILSLRRATDLNPGDGESWSLLGSLELQQGHGDSAMKALENARKVGPASATALSNLGLLYSRSNRHRDAAAVYAEAADIDDNLLPPVFTARVNQGISLVRASQWSDAAAAFEKVLAKDPQNYDALVNLGSILYQQGKFDEAIARFTSATTQKPNVALAWANLASALDSARRYRESADAWKKAADAEPTNHAYADAYRSDLRRTGQVDTLIARDRLEAKRTDKAEPLNDMGKAYVRKAAQAPQAVDKQKNLTAALGSFKEAVKREPRSAAAWNNLGAVYEQRGDITNAILAYKTALRLDPKFSVAQANLRRFIPTYGQPDPQTNARKSGTSRKPGAGKPEVKSATAPRSSTGNSETP